MLAPALRDQYGQEWPFPPIEGPGNPAHDKTWLIFIPGAYTPVCMSELDHVGEMSAKLAELRVGLRLIAPDSAPVLRLVSEQLGIEVPFLSDFWPHGAAAQHYGIFDETTGRPRRVSLLVDRSGDVLDSINSTPGGRDMGEHLAVLQNEK
ncbi:peroxiredoxin [Enteractinococcus fodinae]|uniref:Peroxiredoxin n=1 Tax=Enteractinococcus fodinae TaxID=684663 RepID=A0ABU2B014_9MICC|nr:redoxin domain-containing protein [Enteractinococcus fodinae]MDR7346940.1 peroxiredoxin [Enteractinococcus fodinae]